jgi:hypothetical protein
MYKGTLPSGQGGAGHPKTKHQIRKEFHKQLRELWQQDGQLRWQMENRGGPDNVANEYRRNGYRFIPLASENNTVVCSLEVLFLRRDNPGSLITGGGDIDNRIKVLLDALRMPKGQSEIPIPPSDGEDPFYVLMEDDKLITGLTVITDRLLRPQETDESEKDVFLLIAVKTRVINPRTMYSEAHFT